MKLLLDVQKSLDVCPPNYPNGVKFKKRVVLRRGKDGVVTYPENNNPREDHVIWTQIPLIKDSFVVNGYVHSVSPPTVKQDPDNSNRFIGLTGYHREAACEQLEVDAMMYDVLEFESPLDERKHRTTSNQHRLPFLCNTVDDIIKQIREAVDNKEITNSDKDIKSLIECLADDKTKKVKEKIFKQFRKRVLQPGATTLGYHTEGGMFSTEEFAQKYGIPYGGDKFYAQIKRLGYITGIQTPKTTLFDAKKKSIQYGGQEVEIYAWIQKNAKSGKGLHAQREEFLKNFEQFIMDDCLAIQQTIKLSGINLSIQEIRKNHPIKFKGFLAQDITPNPLNGGNPMEEGVVDINGIRLI